MQKTSVAFLALVALCAGKPALAGLASWQPQASEKLVRMQPSYIVKAVERDFSTSELGSALADMNGRIRAKAATISDVSDAVARTAGETETEMRHQLLAERQAYLALVQEQQDLRRRQARTKARVYGDMLKKLGREGNASTAPGDLARQQEATRNRFAKADAAVDASLMGVSAQPGSRYSAEYAKNVAAIEHLVQAINQHPANAQAEVDGQPVSKETFLRQQVAQAEAELSLIDQEGQIVGYMARLVALDAMALSEAVAGEDLPENLEGMDGLADAVSLFVPE
ncbi:MAG TPA: hypothetical protein DCW68_03505 [Rhodospirillaceae bacterium]|nr:MAG: hypothetical protein A2018_07585 [Alphaproteobacteria bacterium GWF2_58_20]HAU29160.1 hypothetical protein [Rhodospirillaceae bacterium]